MLPKSIKAGYLNIPVDHFVPNLLRCFKCHKYGHGQNTCRGKLTCVRCGQFDHDSKTCTMYLSCTNCREHHFAYSRECLRWQMEQRVQQSWETPLDARTLVETTQPAVAATSYAAVVKTTTRSVSVNTDLTWRHNETQLKNSHSEAFHCYDFDYNVSDVLGFM